MCWRRSRTGWRRGCGSPGTATRSSAPAAPPPWYVRPPCASARRARDVRCLSVCLSICPFLCCLSVCFTLLVVYQSFAGSVALFRSWSIDHNHEAIVVTVATARVERTRSKQSSVVALSQQPTCKYFLLVKHAKWQGTFCIRVWLAWPLLTDAELREGFITLCKWISFSCDKQIRCFIPKEIRVSCLQTAGWVVCM